MSKVTKECLAIITARGGSKGLPGKNIKLLGGRPLLYYSIDVAKQLFGDEDICVSTDDDEIFACVEKYPLHVPFMRPEELATDTAGTYEVLRHAVAFYESKGIYYRYILLLQPTSPFRKESHIRDILALGRQHRNADMIVSVKESKDNPYFNLFEENKNGFLEKSKPGNFVRRQDCPKVYAYNGSIYLISVESLTKKPIAAFEHIVKYEMPVEYSIDIDTQRDWDFAEYSLNRLNCER